MSKQYSSVVECRNCGFSGRVVNDFGKTFNEINCPSCGTPNLTIWNKFLAQTQHIEDGFIGRMEFVTRNEKGQFSSKLYAIDNKEQL